MGKLTDWLLYLSQFDNTQADTPHDCLNLSNLCEHVLLGMEAVAFEKQSHLSYQIQAPVMVNGSSEHLSQVLVILVDNAIKYASKGGYIHVALSNHGQVRLQVTNDGPGIDADHIDKIFNRFYKVDPSRSQSSGYGLGLAIAQTIVDNHQGTLTCTSQPQGPTKFTVKLKPSKAP